MKTTDTYINGSTLDIARLLKCSTEWASKVQADMTCDFSECTTREFNKEARSVDAILKINARADIHCAHGVTNPLCTHYSD